jgi:hypothetical protein
VASCRDIAYLQDIANSDGQTVYEKWFERDSGLTFANVFISSVLNILCYKRSIFYLFMASYRTLPLHGLLPDVASNSDSGFIFAAVLISSCSRTMRLLVQGCSIAASQPQIVSIFRIGGCVMTGLSELKMLQYASLSFRK